LGRVSGSASKQTMPLSLLYALSGGNYFFSRRGHPRGRDCDKTAVLYEKVSRTARPVGRRVAQAGGRYSFGPLVVLRCVLCPWLPPPEGGGSQLDEHKKKGNLAGRPKIRDTIAPIRRGANRRWNTWSTYHTTPWGPNFLEEWMNCKGFQLNTASQELWGWEWRAQGSLKMLANPTGGEGGACA